MFEEHLQGEEQQFVVPPHPKYQFKLTPAQKIKCQTLVIAFYGPASLFAHSLIPSKSPDARVNFLKAKQTSLADFYLVNGLGYLIFNGDVQKMKEVYFQQFVVQSFQFERAIILTHDYVNNLEKQSNVCLQHIKTSAWKDQISCNRYQEGLMGMPADLLVWGQISKVRVCCYVALLKDYQLSRQSIQEVFGSLVGKEGLNEVSQITDKIKKYNMKKYSNTIYL